MVPSSASLSRPPLPRERLVVPVALLAMGILAIAALGALPESHALRQRADLFPPWLHALMEFAAVSVSLMIFTLVWHAYRRDQPVGIVALACGFLAVGALDLMHLLSYSGMPDFVTPASTQKSISFWLAARFASAFTLLVVAFAPWRPLRAPAARQAMLAAALAAVALVSLTILFAPGNALPVFFVPGVGVTGVKIAAEWLSVALTAAAALRIWAIGRRLPGLDAPLVICASVLLMLASLALVMYANVNDAFSLVGHLCKVAGFYVIYRLVFVASVREPYERLALETAARESAQRQAWRLQYTDALTGLPNREQMRVQLAAELAAAHGGPGPALLLVDLDGFSVLNDLNGHAFGDGVLRVVGERLAGHAQAPLNTFRLGGDEFAVIAAAPPDAATAAAFGARLAADVAAPMRVFGQEVSITACVGIALSPSAGAADADALARNASTALHRAKVEGPGTCRVHEPTMDREVAERVSLRGALRQALARREMRVHYQPQLDLRTGQVTGAEALLWWQHPTMGAVGPGRFIPLAEETGEIVAIGDWILNEACRQAAAWRHAGTGIGTMAVNFSARQFHEEDVVERVHRALADSGLPSSVLEIEITESVLIRDTEAMLASLRALKALGVRVAVDDFGTGYSSLAYLHAFPLDKLKIDQSFVRDLGRRADGQVVVRAIVQLARALGLEPVAEGVEDEEAARMLRELGCVHAQGYLYARPLSPAEFEAFVRPRTVLATA